MTAPSTPPESGPSSPSGLRMAGIGCFMVWVGFFSGAMIGVLVSLAVAFFTKAPRCEGIPTCDWYIYMFAGGALGAVTLPALVLSALRRPSAPAAESADDKN